MRILGLLLVACAGVLLLCFAAAGIRTSGYWPAKMTEAERHRRSRRLGSVVTPVFGVAFLAMSVGAFMASHDWVVLAAVGCFGVTQVAFVAHSQYRARQGAARRQAGSAR